MEIQYKPQWYRSKNYNAKSVLSPNVIYNKSSLDIRFVQYSESKYLNYIKGVPQKQNITNSSETTSTISTGIILI